MHAGNNRESRHMQPACCSHDMIVDCCKCHDRRLLFECPACHTLKRSRSQRTSCQCAHVPAAPTTNSAPHQQQQAPALVPLVLRSHYSHRYSLLLPWLLPSLTTTTACLADAAAAATTAVAAPVTTATTSDATDKDDACCCSRSCT